MSVFPNFGAHCCCGAGGESEYRPRATGGTRRSPDSQLRRGRRSRRRRRTRPSRRRSCSRPGTRCRGRSRSIPGLAGGPTVELAPDPEAPRARTSACRTTPCISLGVARTSTPRAAGRVVGQVQVGAVRRDGDCREIGRSATASRHRPNASCPAVARVEPVQTCSFGWLGVRVGPSRPSTTIVVGRTRHRSGRRWRCDLGTSRRARRRHRPSVKPPTGSKNRR